MDQIAALKKKGLSKWAIAKLLGVSWRTVHHWERGFFMPTEDNLQKLNNLVKEKEIKPNGKR